MPADVVRIDCHHRRGAPEAFAVDVSRSEDVDLDGTHGAFALVICVGRKRGPHVFTVQTIRRRLLIDCNVIQRSATAFFCALVPEPIRPSAKELPRSLSIAE